jgi:hypothetical protein
MKQFKNIDNITRRGQPLGLIGVIIIKAYTGMSNNMCRGF